MARNATFANKKAVVNVLNQLPVVREAGPVSYYHLRQLVKDGYVTIDNGGEVNGRKRRVYVTSLKGRRLLSLARNIWDKA